MIPTIFIGVPKVHNISVNFTSVENDHGKVLIVLIQDSYLPIPVLASSSWRKRSIKTCPIISLDDSFVDRKKDRIYPDVHTLSLRSNSTHCSTDPPSSEPSSSIIAAKRKGAWGSNPDPQAYRDIIYYSYKQIVLRC
jgi:hypothetical protein